MKLHFIKASPTENMTLLIRTHVPRERQLAVAEQLIAYGSVYAEQAGYIEEPQNPRAAKRLQMMAGEFCGNASLSLAAWLAWEQGIGVGETREIVLEVSGAETLVRCEITQEGGGFSGKVAMPLPKSVETRTFWLEGKAYELPVVAFAGISHVILPTAAWSVAAAEKAARAWAAELPPAFGMLLFDEAEESLRPLVSVQGASLIWERGCGSGTAAIGAYLAMRAGASQTVTLRQPGGEMGVAAGYEAGRIVSLSITGKVFLVAEGTAYLTAKEA